MRNCITQNFSEPLKRLLTTVHCVSHMTRSNNATEKKGIPLIEKPKWDHQLCGSFFLVRLHSFSFLPASFIYFHYFFLLYRLLTFVCLCAISISKAWWTLMCVCVCKHSKFWTFFFYFHSILLETMLCVFECIWVKSSV